MNSEQMAWRIRRHAIEMTHISKSSHIGSILSVADIIAVLYTDVLKFDPKDPGWKSRDRMIFSKGHACAAVYAALAETGFIPLDELMTHYADGGRLSGHITHHIPGVEFSTGSLGHGFAAAAGMAYAAKKDGNMDHMVYAVLGDGECNEGSVWETALFANHFRLNNLVAVIDYNHMQGLDYTENTLELESFSAKWSAFGWNTVECDGNDHGQLKDAFRRAANFANSDPHKPTVIIASTVKGSGISFMENDVLWHYRFPHDGWEYDQAVAELHAIIPEDVTDPYTPNGIENPAIPVSDEDPADDHSLTKTWKPKYPEKMRRAGS